MQAEANIQIVCPPPVGWLELRDKIMISRNMGKVIETPSGPAKIHIHREGVTVQMPDEIIEHLRQCCQYMYTHDQMGNELPEPKARSLRVTFTLT